MASSRADLTVSPFYHQAKNEIVQPGQFVACSRYFVRRWMPLLGGTTTALVLHLRSLGYYNPQTGELRDGVRVGMKELATACGVSDRTIQREIEKNPWLPFFVRVESSYEQLADGRIRHHENVYRIAMDDPLHPDDEPRLEAIIVERERSRFNPDPATADGRTKRRAASDSRQRQMARARGDSELTARNLETPVDDILSPPLDDHERQTVTRVASKCRLKDSTDIPGTDLPTDLLNNSGAGPQSADAAPCVVVEIASLVSEMTGLGVSRIVAEGLAAQFPPGDIRLQLEALPLRNANDPPAVLVKSIRENWGLPPALSRSLKRQLQKPQHPMDEQQIARMEAEKEARSEALVRIEAYWRDLSPTERDRIEAEARESLRRTNPFVAQLMERAGEGKIVKATLESIRRQIVCGRLGIQGQTGPP